MIQTHNPTHGMASSDCLRNYLVADNWALSTSIEAGDRHPEARSYHPWVTITRFQGLRFRQRLGFGTALPCNNLYQGSYSALYITTL